MLCISWQDIIRTHSKIVLGENFFNIRLTDAFLYGVNFSPKMWRSGAKITVSGAVLQWRYCDGWKILAEKTARWCKGLKGGTRRGGAN